jgi:long-chain acyl-CoA synthetase
MCVGNILRRGASKFPDKTAIIFQDKRINYSELNRRVNCLANSLLNMGLKKGDRVAVLVHNCPEFIEMYFACAKSGGVFVPINNLFRQKELLDVFDYIKPRFLFFDQSFGPMIQEIVPNLGFNEFRISLNGPSGDSRNYEDLISAGKGTEPTVPISDDDLISIFLTSGTTGRPKGAMRKHRHDLINALSCAIESGIRYDDRVLLLFPFFHITYVDNLRHLLMSNTIVIRREGAFSPKDVLSLLAKEQVTVCQFVPTMINAMLQEESIEGYDLSRFRLLMYAASPMPLELLKKAIKKFKCKFIQFYGQTETGPCTTALSPEDHALDGNETQMARLASAGRPIVDYELRIVDEDGRDLPVGDVGEIIVRGEAMTVGYWNLPEETESTIRDGWLRTGDYGRLDEEGYVFIVDRKHDMIISGGKNIYPREIEEVIYSHDAVLETAVIGVPDDYWGESVKAFVVLKDGMEATEQEIIDLCKNTVASYKKPKTVEFLEQLPKSPAGKILKRVIREKFWAGRDRRI